MNNNEKKIIYLLTFFIDFFLINILKNRKLNKFDKYFIILILLLHSYFYVCIYKNIKYGIDLCHYALAISFILSVFLKNLDVLYLCFVLLIIIQILWKCFDKCILNNNKQTFFGPYSTKMVIITKIISIILFIKILPPSLRIT